MKESIIYLDQNDIDLFIGFCKQDGVISRNFMDWYIGDNAFMQKQGYFVTDWKSGDVVSRLCFGYDVTDVDNVKVQVINYATQKVMFRYIFNRFYKENIKMENVRCIITTPKESLYSSFMSQKEVYFTGGKSIDRRITEIIEKIKSSKDGKNTKHNLKKKALYAAMDEVFHDYCTMCIYALYATMFYVVKNPKELIEGAPQVQEEATQIITVSKKYVYTGFVDITKNKVYRRKKLPDEPTREYQRHIERWHVRGHYRKTKDGFIWIEPHIKGKGENIENRVYGTDEDKVKVMPKIFDVVKTVKVFNKEQSKPDFNKQLDDAYLRICVWVDNYPMPVTYT